MPREIRAITDVPPVTVDVAKNDFKDRLVKLIPSEIVTAYVTIQSLIQGAEAKPENITTLLWIVCILLFLFTPVYLYYVGNVKKWGQIIFTTLAFAIWVVAIGSPVNEILGFTSTFIGSILLVLYTLMIPLFYKG